MAQGEISLKWGDGEHVFNVAPIGRLRELQNKTGVGPYALLRRIVAGDWFVDDIRETIRIGLIGGGMDPVSALALVAIYFDERPKAESVPIAQEIILSALSGEPKDPPGDEDEGSKKKKSPGSRSKRKKVSSVSP